MDKEKLFDSLDGLFAYDSGCVSSGIKDELLKKEISLFLKEQITTYQTYPDILAEFVKEFYIDPPYGLETVKNFITWVDDLFEFY